MWRRVCSGAAVDVGKSCGRTFIWAESVNIDGTVCPGFLSDFLCGSCSRGNSVAECQVSEPCGGKWIHLTGFLVFEAAPSSVRP